MTLAFRGVEITYPDSGKTLHYHQDFSLSSQGFTLLMGPSGCGKTTLFHSLAGLVPLATGEILAPVPATIALQFQEPRLFPWRTVGQHLLDVGRGDPLPYLRAVGLEEEQHQYPGSLSGGMARRLSLARCLHYGACIQASLYLLDEPFAGMEEARILQLLPLLEALEAPVWVASHLPLLQSKAQQIHLLQPSFQSVSQSLSQTTSQSTSQSTSQILSQSSTSQS